MHGSTAPSRPSSCPGTATALALRWLGSRRSTTATPRARPRRCPCRFRSIGAGPVARAAACGGSAAGSAPQSSRPVTSSLSSWCTSSTVRGAEAPSSTSSSPDTGLVGCYPTARIIDFAGSGSRCPATDPVFNPIGCRALAVATSDQRCGGVSRTARPSKRPWGPQRTASGSRCPSRRTRRRAPPLCPLGAQSGQSRRRSRGPGSSGASPPACPPSAALQPCNAGCRGTRASKVVPQTRHCNPAGRCGATAQ